MASFQMSPMTSCGIDSLEAEEDEHRRAPVFVLADVC